MIKRPLRQLAEEAGIALKDRRSELHFTGSYKELQALVEAFNRLLYLVQPRGTQQWGREGHQPPAAAQTTAPEQPAPRPAPTQVEEPAPQQLPDADREAHLELPPDPAPVSSGASGHKETRTEPQPAPKPPAQPVASPEPPSEAARAAHSPAARPVDHPEERPSSPKVAQAPPASPAVHEEPKTSQRPVETASPPPTSPADTSSPSCVIDLKRYVLLSCNKAFVETFLHGQEPGTDLHMLVAFEDPDMVNTLSTMAEDPAPQTSSRTPGQPGYTVRKAPAPGLEHAAVFTFDP